MFNYMVSLIFGLLLVVAPLPAMADGHPWGVEGNLDSDRDGVMDYDDRCPNTKYCCFVDYNGCPIDKDEDGVCDGYWDKCPDTPKGAWVDEKGCPKDSDGDGVLDGLDKCPDTPRDLKVDPDGCPIQVKISKTVYFDTDKFDLKPEALVKLMQVANFMAEYPKSVAVIYGHTDSRASEKHNLTLSLRRAESVRDFLAGQPGLDGARLKVEALGESKPAAANDTPAGMQKNRRVEIVVSPAFVKR